MNLSGQVAFISDGQADSGCVLAQHLARQGARVVVNVSPSADLSALQDSWVAAEGPRNEVLWTQHDLCHQAGVDALWAEMVGRWGQVSIFVHNSNQIEPQTVESCEVASYQALMEINVKSAFLLTQAFGRQPDLAAGRIIYVSTIHDQKPTGSSFVYAAAKGALSMLAREAALDLGRRGVTVNLIEMGAVAGDDVRFASDLSDLYVDYRWKVPSASLGTYEDLAHLVGFLSLPESRFLNGASIRLDGGFILHYLNHKMKHE